MRLTVDSAERSLEPIRTRGWAGRWCLPASLGAHAAVLALTVGLAGEAQLKGDNQIPIDVDIITVSEMTSPDSAPSAVRGDDGGMEAAEPKPLDVAETKPVEMAALHPVEEVEPLALEPAHRPEATDLAPAEENAPAKPAEPARQEMAEAAPAPSAAAEESKHALPLLATRSEALDSVSATQEPRELAPVPGDKAEEKVKPDPKAARKKKEAKKKEIKVAKIGKTAREGKARKKEAALASGRNAEASTGKRARSSGEASMSNYLGQIAARLQRQKRYPEEARRNGVRGTVSISFTINSSGRVTGSRLVGSSGVAALDKEARAMLSRASPFPPIPEGMGRSSISITVPIRFSMN